MLFLAVGLATEDIPKKGVFQGGFVWAITDISPHNLAESREGMVEFMWQDSKAIFICWGPVPEGWEPLVGASFSRMEH